MTQKTSTMAGIAVAGLLAILAPAFAQNQGQGKGGGTSQQDEKFAMNAAVGGMMEVEAGQLAAQKAVNADVKSFGQRMVQDHGKANTQLLQIASQKGMTLPKELPADMKQHKDMLTKASGAEFDRQYMAHMVKDHEKTVKDFEMQAKNGNDAALRAFAEQNLPIIREHLEMARTLATKVGADTKGDHSGHSGH